MRPDATSFQAAASSADWTGTKDAYLVMTDAPGGDAYSVATTGFSRSRALEDVIRGLQGMNPAAETGIMLSTGVTAVLWITYKVARRQPARAAHLPDQIGMALSVIACLMFLSRLPRFFFGMMSDVVNSSSGVKRHPRRIAKQQESRSTDPQGLIGSSPPHGPP